MFIISWIGKLWRRMEANTWKVLAWALALNIMFGVAFYYAERGVQEGLTLIDSLWWSMVTMTTVGYGDFYAQTPIGRFLISYPCMILGIGIIGYLVGVVANTMLDWAARKRKGEMETTYSDHIILCNYPGVEKVMTVIRQLKASTDDKVQFVLITEILDELPEVIRKEKVQFVKGYPTDEAALMQAKILDCDGVIILAEDPHEQRSDDRTIATASMIEMIEQEKKQQIKVICELVGNRSIRNIERATVNGYVSNEDLTGCLLAQEYSNPGVNQVIGQIVSFEMGSELYIHETRMTGHPIVELQKAVLEHDANIQIIGLMRDGQQMLNPDKHIKIGEGDKLIVLAECLQDLTGIEQDILNKTGQTV